jgi:hypothetical protein
LKIEIVQYLLRVAAESVLAYGVMSVLIQFTMGMTKVLVTIVPHITTYLLSTTNISSNKRA